VQPQAENRHGTAVATAVSVVVAVVIGGLETLNLVRDLLGLSDGGGFWGVIGAISNNFGILGYFILGIFVVGWLISFTVYRAKKYDEIEVNRGDSIPRAFTNVR
jgi:high-affinity nickel-transport protein